MTSFLFKIKKLALPLIIITTILVGIFAFLNIGSEITEANRVTDWLRVEWRDTSLTFTRYEGELAQLSEEGYDPALVATTDLRSFILRIVNFALGFLGLIAVIIIIYGGILYVLSGGEDERTQTGKNAIKYAVIGLLIVLGSYAFVNTIIGGVVGEEDIRTGVGAPGTTIAGSFNASAEQVRSSALGIVSGFEFVKEVTEEFKDIKNDLEKESIQPENFPEKREILTMLNSIESKLINIRGKLPAFSEGEVKINDFLRELRRDIDNINRLNKIGIIVTEERGIGEPCDFVTIRSDMEEKEENLAKDEEEDEDEVDIDKIQEEIQELKQDLNLSNLDLCNKKYPASKYISYIEGLYKEWNDIHKKYNEYKLEEIVDIFVKNDYKKELEENLKNIENLYITFENLAPIKEGRANEAIEIMRGVSAFGYKYNFEKDEFTSEQHGFLHKIENWNFPLNVNLASQLMLNGVEQLRIIYEELENIQFVQARLSADRVEGPAPLSITFDILGTVDPAGGSIRPENIVWDLGGTMTLVDLMKGERSLEEHEFVTCEGLKIEQENQDNEQVAETVQRCTFHRPGNYTAAVKINSNEPTRFAPGISVLNIRVRPPTTKIELKMDIEGEEDDIVISSYDGEIISIDRSEVVVTASNAKVGITFDASDTRNAERFKWDFGDGPIKDWSTAPTADHAYEEKGDYEVILEVRNALGVIDRKIFTVRVTDIVARVFATPREKAFLNTPVIFNARGSKSDMGSITNYKWTITPKDVPEEFKDEISEDYSPFEISKSDLSILEHTFLYPIKYDIEVEVRDNAGNTAKEIIKDYEVESQEPVPIFDYSIPKETQPGTVHFDARRSYHPDGLGGDLNYEWSISPETGWEVIDESRGLTTQRPIIKFTEKDDYEVTLKVIDSFSNDDELTEEVTIDKVIDVALADDQVIVYRLDDNGEVEVAINPISEKAIAYEIDFDDGNTDTGDMPITNITNTYTQAGKYTVKLTVYDEDDDRNELTRRIFIGGGDNPVARIGLKVGDIEYYDFSQPIQVSKQDRITFDAGASQNLDGTGRNLRYSWNFGDTGRSSSRTATHRYKELSPEDPGYFEISLQVADERDPTKNDTDTIRIKVVNLPPTFSGLQAIPQITARNFVTPLDVDVKVFGAEDPDGEITQYRWWYFDVDSPDEQLGIQITTAPRARMTIGTRAEEGTETIYGFGLEVMDNEGETYSNKQDIEEGNFFKLDVVNGPFHPPTAKFNISATRILVGEEITFSSASTAHEGHEIVQYVWDVEGDGFYNNEPTARSTITHRYEKQNMEGYNVRLKVIDDQGAEAVSDPIRVFVESLADDPVAAFNYEVVKGSDGMQIQFKNNSRADEEAGAKIIDYKWDFNIEVDTTGDGIPDNDIDSRAENPAHTYTTTETYGVKLTVIDSHGNTDSVVNRITIPLADPPVAAFLYEIKDDQVVFKNNSTADEENGARLEKFIWDFNAEFDSTGDGIPDNDQDSTLKEPVHKYPQSGVYKVKLTVIDSYGSQSEVVREVDYVREDIVPVDPEYPVDPEDPEAPTAGLQAVLKTNPSPGRDGVIYLPGPEGRIQFDYSESQGPIAYYTFDKNIYFDSTGDGVRDNDIDFRSVLPGTWTTNFTKTMGRIVVKLTVQDIYGNKDSTTIEVKFE